MEGKRLTAADVSYAPLELSVAHQAIRAEVDSLLTLQWVQHVNADNYQGGWDVLPLRCQEQYYEQHVILQSFSVESLGQWIDLPALQHCPHISEFIKQLQCEVGAVRLMRLKAEAYIKPHRDKGLAMEHGEARLHLPICGSQGIEFVVNNKTVPMREGKLWYINADQIHSVRNHGEVDRINLVIDCKVNDWLRRLILPHVG